MEYPDLLHTLWIGTVRDCVGAMLLDMAEYSPLCSDPDLPTWDQRLQARFSECMHAYVHMQVCFLACARSWRWMRATGAVSMACRHPWLKTGVSYMQRDREI